MSSKISQRKGWLWAWFSKAAIRGRRDLDRGLRKLHCETLERRELLSVTLGPVSQSFQTIQVQSASGTVTGEGYAATANLTGSINYTSPTQGTVSGGLSGTINAGSDAGETFNASFNNVAQTSDNLSGPVVTGVSPNEGSTTHDTAVTITGSGFTGATAVDFGTIPSAYVTVNASGTQITATSPPETLGSTVDVTVVSAARHVACYVG